MITNTLPKKLTKEMKVFAIQVISEVLDDPDFGLEFKRKFVKKVKKSFGEKDAKLYSLKDLKI